MKKLKRNFEEFEEKFQEIFEEMLQKYNYCRIPFVECVCAFSSSILLYETV